MVYQSLESDTLSTAVAAFKEYGSCGRFAPEWVEEAIAASGFRASGQAAEYEEHIFNQTWKTEKETLSDDEDHHQAVLPNEGDTMKVDCNGTDCKEIDYDTTSVATQHDEEASYKAASGSKTDMATNGILVEDNTTMSDVNGTSNNTTIHLTNGASSEDDTMVDCNSTPSTKCDQVAISPPSQDEKMTGCSDTSCNKTNEVIDNALSEGDQMANCDGNAYPKADNVVPSPSSEDAKMIGVFETSGCETGQAEIRSSPQEEKIASDHGASCGQNVQVASGAFPETDPFAIKDDIPGKLDLDKKIENSPDASTPSIVN